MRFTIILLLLFLVLLPACKTREKVKEKPKKEIEESSKEKAVEPAINLQKFESEEYDFNFNFPSDWTFESFTQGNDQFILNFFSKEKKNKLDLPILVHTQAENSFVGFYPEGYGTELPMGKSRPLNDQEIQMITFPLNTDKSQVFTLENSQPWGYFLVPSSPPPSWDEYGFVFAQSAVENSHTLCMDAETGEEKPMENCDPIMGDKIKKYGDIPGERVKEMRIVLSSIDFK